MIETKSPRRCMLPLKTEMSIFRRMKTEKVNYAEVMKLVRNRINSDDIVLVLLWGEMNGEGRDSFWRY